MTIVRREAATTRIAPSETAMRPRLWAPDPLRDGYALVATAWTLAIAAGLVGWGQDAAEFYTNRLPDPYTVTDYASGSGFYWSPIAAIVLYPLTLFGLQVFTAILTGMGFLSLYALLGRWAFLGLFFPPVWWDLSAGNINTVLGVVFVLGLRYPALWSVALLTKVTPGIGLLWFAVRREWREFGVAIGLTAAFTLGSAVVVPGLWAEWIGALRNSAGASAGPGFFTLALPLAPRLVVAAGLIVVAARSDRRWLLVIACVLAMPVIWYNAMGALVAVPRLVGRN